MADTATKTPVKPIDAPVKRISTEPTRKPEKGCGCGD